MAAPANSGLRGLACALSALVAVASLACSAGSAKAPDAKYLTVFVSSDGVIVADGQELSLARLEEELDQAKAANAVILFARGPAERGRGSVAMLVLGAIERRQLKLRRCAQRDCSDAIAPDGKLRPQ
jgi:hypothetical protein